MTGMHNLNENPLPLCIPVSNFTVGQFPFSQFAMEADA